MNDHPVPETCSDLKDAHRRLREFRRGKTDQRLFVQPSCHPSEPMSFCDWERSWWRAIVFYLKAILMEIVFKLPFNGPKVWMLRAMGAKVGRHVDFTPGKDSEET